jgi:hypothetical protein
MVEEVNLPMLLLLPLVVVMVVTVIGVLVVLVVAVGLLVPQHPLAVMVEMGL